MTAFCRAIRGRGLQPLASAFPSDVAVVDQNDVSSATAVFGFKPDGTFSFQSQITVYTNFDPPIVGPNKWLEQTGDLAGAGWFVRLSGVTSGPGVSGPALGTWVSVLDAPVWSFGGISSSTTSIVFEIKKSPTEGIADATLSVDLTYFGFNP